MDLNLRRARIALVAIALLCVTPAVASAASPAADVSAAISGSKLTVDFSAAAHSTCQFQLGSGASAVSLPSGRTDGHGQGTITHALPDDSRKGRRAVFASCAHRGHNRVGKAYVVIPANLGSAGDGSVATVLNVLLDLLLGGSLLLFAWLLIEMVVKASDPQEKLMRALALVGGAVIALAAEASGVSFADFTIDTLTGARPGGGAFTAFSAIVPGGMGAFFAWYFVRMMRTSADMALRLMSFLGMLTIVGFAVIFAQATHVQGVMLGVAAIPNASFVVGLIAGVVAFLPPADAAASSGRRFGRLRDAVSRRGAPAAPGLVGAVPDASATAPLKRNPFADD